MIRKHIFFKRVYAHPGPARPVNFYIPIHALLKPAIPARPRHWRLRERNEHAKTRFFDHVIFNKKLGILRAAHRADRTCAAAIVEGVSIISFHAHCGAAIALLVRLILGLLLQRSVVSALGKINPVVEAT
ncbi:hypothetical protein [Neorhizobium sp. T6_25]|uniref:hypothetical protein n=1 Tax=Neorhizobium sp. T6_25 TaxID=2093833 RepID=UPI000CF93202|nr:hypothetical protein [Neorhizobium sp. T6_25]